MVTTCNIYVVNHSMGAQTFWCFLAPPPELANDPGVYANSSASVAVAPNSPASFTIGAGNIVGVGATYQAVGLNVQIVSDVSYVGDSTQTFDADYTTVPPDLGPTLSLSGASAPPNTIAIVSNAFNQMENENGGWYSNMSFGTEAEQGFIGMTWSPAPQTTRTLTVTDLTFYIAVGSFGNNVLASWNQVTSNAAQISVPNSFSGYDYTVTYNANGTWTVSPGRPATGALAANTQELAKNIAEWLSGPHAKSGAVQVNTIVNVRWNPPGGAGGETVVSGLLTVNAALVAAFKYFVLAGVTFSISYSNPGATRITFQYTGTMSPQAVMSLFRAGAQIFLGG